MKIRKRYIQQKVLEFYQELPERQVALPLDISAAIDNYDNIALMSYESFASTYNLHVSDIIAGSESKDGVTYHKIDTNLYIILYNSAANAGRQRFTIAHEMGHILLNHMPDIAAGKIASNNLSGDSNPILEQEADWFASMVLCPFPILKKMGVSSAQDIKRICGISSQASLIKYEQYTGWVAEHQKTAWESDMSRIFFPFLSAVRQDTETHHSDE